MSDTFWLIFFSICRVVFKPVVILLLCVMLTVSAGSIHIVYRTSMIDDFQIYLKPNFTFQHTLVNLDTPEGIEFLRRMPREEIAHLSRRFDMVEYLIRSGPRY